MQLRLEDTRSYIFKAVIDLHNIIYLLGQIEFAPVQMEHKFWEKRRVVLKLK
jgi:hypothetical protein